MSGYVRIHRTLLGHPSFRNESETMAFAWLIAKASWRPIRVRYKGHSISLKRGQVAVSQRDMAGAFDRDKAWIERLWKRLKSEAMIEAHTEAGVAVITICNYDQYQGDDDEREAPRKARGETPNEADVRQRRGTEQEREKGKKSSSVAKATSPRAKFAPPPNVSKDQWAAFRAQRKKPINERSYTLLCNKLLKLSEDGWPPGDMIDLAIERGWETVFAPRTQNHGHSASNVTSLRGSRPDPALDLYRAACAAEDREDNLRAGPSLPALGSGGP